MPASAQGGTLRDVLSSTGARRAQWQNRGKHIMLDVVRGVCHLHSNGVEHRSITSKVGGPTLLSEKE